MQSFPFFLMGHFEFFWIFFTLIPMKISHKIMRQNGWGSILMFSQFSSKFLAMCNVTLYSECALCIILFDFIMEEALKLKNLGNRSMVPIWKLVKEVHLEGFKSKIAYSRVASIWQIWRTKSQKEMQFFQNRNESFFFA